MSEERKPRPSLKDIANAVAARESNPPGSVRIASVPAAPMSRPPLGSRPSNPPGSLLDRARAEMESNPRISSPPNSSPPGSRDPSRPSVPPASRDPRISSASSTPMAVAPPSATGSGHVDLGAVSRVSQPPSSSPAPSTRASSPVVTTSGVSATPASPSIVPAEERGKGTSPLLLAAMAAVGIGAVAFAIMRTSSPAPAPAPTPAPTPQPMLAVSAPASAASPAPAEVTKPADGVVDIAALAAPVAPPTVSGPLRPLNKDKDKDKDADKPEAAKPAESAPAPAPEASAATPAPTGSVGALADEIRKRAGAKDGEAAADTAAGPNADAKQQKPSAGAVSGAIGAVRGAARACVDGLEAITRVQVTFSSDGSVKSVSVSGGAAGTPAEACVKAAVSKAKVQPFTDPSYGTSFSIRP